MASKPLGRGLNALLGKDKAASHAASTTQPGETVRKVPVHQVVRCPFQPRKEFDHAELQELADSIRAQGIIQPLIVRSSGVQFELIAGERRWRAAQMAGLREVPVLVRQATNLEVAELALIENLQRVDLNPIEEAEGYERLQKEFDLTQEQMAEKVGKARASVANSLRLLDLDPELKGYVSKGQISVGHAKVLLGLDNAELQRACAQEVIRQSLSVRKTEEWVARSKDSSTAGSSSTQKKKSAQSAPDAHVRDIQLRLQQHLGTQVNIHQGTDKGRLEIQFYGMDDLFRLSAAMGLKEP